MACWSLACRGRNLGIFLRGLHPSYRYVTWRHLAWNVGKRLGGNQRAPLYSLDVSGHILMNDDHLRSFEHGRRGVWNERQTSSRSSRKRVVGTTKMQTNGSLVPVSGVLGCARW